jgi:hypothetical protein
MFKINKKYAKSCVNFTDIQENLSDNKALRRLYPEYPPLVSNALIGALFLNII